MQNATALFTNVVEIEFYEVRRYGVLGSSAKNEFLRISGRHIDILRTGVPTPRDPRPGKVG
jgi:hypothetical protein